MGNCCDSTFNKGNINHSPKIISHKKKLDDSLEISNDDFPDMPLWNNGKKTGFGIKEMPAYKCDLKTMEYNTSSSYLPTYKIRRIFS